MAVDLRIPVPPPAVPASSSSSPSPSAIPHAHAPPPIIAAECEPAALPLPPLIPGAPLLGSALAIFRDPVALFVRLYREVGPVFRLRVPGRAYTVMAGPEATLFLARGGDEQHFTSRPVFARAMRELRTEEFIAALEGEAHRRQRALLKPALSREAIARYIPRMVQTATWLSRDWHPGQRLRVKPAMQRLVAEQMAYAMTGSEAGERFHDAVTFAETLVGAGVAGTWPALMLRRPTYRAAKARVVALMERLIRDRRALGNRAPRAVAHDLLDTLLAARDAHGEPLDDVALVVGAQLPYIAGMDTAAATCGFLLYALLSHPALLEQVTAEVDAAFASSGGAPDAEAFHRMPTLHAAAMETFRRYPVVSAAPRYARHPFAFAGHRIEPGQMVLVSTTAAHFLPELFPDPYAFDVERYRPPRNEHRQPGAFAPFAAGPHTCVASGVAETVVLTTVATLLHTLRLRLDPPDYTLRTTINPLPGPERRFAVRVVERRLPVRPRITSPRVR